VTDWRGLESFSFGDSPELADELAALVLAGTITATSSAFSDGPSTEVGKRMVMLDNRGDCWQPSKLWSLPNGRSTVLTPPSLMMRARAMGVAPIGSAHPGDISPVRVGQFAGDTLLYCERFRVVERIEGAGED
jgi:hypothetical protein